jgi:hypothetical protein
MAEPQIAPTPPTQTPSAAGPVMDVVAPPPLANPPNDGRAGTQPAPADQPAKKALKPKTPPKQGVTAAITATVIIVLGLAALAVLAYIKTK